MSLNSQGENAGFSEKTRWYTRPRYLIALSLIIFGIWAGSGFLFHSWFDDWPKRSAFGDMFGAINALFSGFALAGIILAVVLQSRELELQRKELEMTRKELARTAKAQEEAEKAMKGQLEIEILLARVNAISSIISFSSSRANAYGSGSQTARLIMADKKPLEDKLLKILKELEEHAGVTNDEG